MNKLLLVSFLGFLALVWGQQDDLDHVDVDEVLGNPRLVDNYIACVKTGQKCTPDGQKLRENIPNALKSKCSECSDEQKERAYKVLRWVIQHRPQDFLEIEKVHDPEHHYRNEFAAELQTHNIVLPPLQ